MQHTTPNFGDPADTNEAGHDSRRCQFTPLASMLKTVFAMQLMESVRGTRSFVDPL